MRTLRKRCKRTPGTLDMEVTFAWYETQAVLARRYFRQIDEVVQIAVGKTDKTDLFEIGEMELALDSMVHNKGPATMDSVWKSSVRSFSTTLSDCYHCTIITLMSLKFNGVWKRAVAIYFSNEGRNKSNSLPTVLFICFSRLGRCAIRLADFLESNNMLDGRQYVFCRSHSTVNVMRNNFQDGDKFLLTFLIQH